MAESTRNRELVTLVIGLYWRGSLLVARFVSISSAARGAQLRKHYAESPQPDAVLGTPDQRSTPAATSDSQMSETFIDRLFGTHHSEAYVSGDDVGRDDGTNLFGFLLAALLGAALAFRPRKRILALKRNPYVSQTQILLAIVAAALMIIVGDNAARAFGIFAAVSLVRFRTNIRDPKEITVLLISLALGLASGVGRWDLALVLALFSLIVLWLLEWREPEQVFRSMELKVITKNVVSTQKALRGGIQDSRFR